MIEGIRVLIADDHPLVRQGLHTILDAEPDLRVVGEAANGWQAQQMCSIFQPDVLLLDLHMPNTQPLDVITTVQQRCPFVKILILTAHYDSATAPCLIAAGVSGYALKDEDRTP